MPAWQRLAARANHALLYALILALPLAGYLGSAFSGYPVKYFGIVLPAWTGRYDAGKEFMSALHLGLAWMLSAAVALHVLAVVWHTSRDGGALLARMRLRPRRRAPPLPDALPLADADQGSAVGQRPPAP
jgi:cytochrome b561